MEPSQRSVTGISFSKELIREAYNGYLPIYMLDRQIRTDLYSDDEWWAMSDIGRITAQLEIFSIVNEILEEVKNGI